VTKTISILNSDAAFKSFGSVGISILIIDLNPKQVTPPSKPSGPENGPCHRRGVHDVSDLDPEQRRRLRELRERRDLEHKINIDTLGGETADITDSIENPETVLKATLATIQESLRITRQNGADRRRTWWSTGRTPRSSPRRQRS
jgi:hypothetical protein